MKRNKPMITKPKHSFPKYRHHFRVTLDLVEVNYTPDQSAVDVHRTLWAILSQHFHSPDSVSRIRARKVSVKPA